MNLLTFTLPAHWAPALVNDDRSGMTDAEESAMDEWCYANFLFGAHCVNVSDGNDDDAPGFLTYHDAHQYVLACDCLIFTFDVGGAV